MRKFLPLAALLACPALASAASIQQYASSELGCSSQYSTTDWSAAQALGAPDTFSYGDIPTAWASASYHGTSEYLTLGFDTPVHATGVTVRETCGNGFVTQVDLLDLSDVLHTIWTGTDPSLPGSPVDFSLNWSATSYAVKGVKVYVNTSATGTWEEIDAVQLRGNAVDGLPGTAVPTPAAAAAVPALLGVLALRRRPRA